jgi:hypothetical protein
MLIAVIVGILFFIYYIIRDKKPATKFVIRESKKKCSWKN